MSYVGKILVAHPKMTYQSPFFQSVVYIGHEDDNGVNGIIVNRPTSYTVSEFMNRRGYDFISTRHKMRFGGPVNTSTVFMLHSDEWTSSSTMKAGPGYSISCDDFMLEKLSMGYLPVYFRMVVGMASWYPGQLDNEISRSDWLIATANDDILFNYDGEKQWNKALELVSREVINSYF